jgi:hypothetical protein
MIQLIAQCGIGLLVGCVLTLALFPSIRRGAARPASREVAAARPLTTTEIQAEKDQMRAEFVQSVRRLEIGVEKIREKALARLGPADNRAAELGRLQAELDKKAVQIVSLRAQAAWHKTVARKIVKPLLYAFARTRRQQRPVVAPPPVFKFEQGPQWELKRKPAPAGYASVAAFSAKASSAESDLSGLAATLPAATLPATPLKVQPAPSEIATTAVPLAPKAQPPHGEAFSTAMPPAPKPQPVQNDVAVTVTPLAPKAQPAQNDLAATAAAIAAVNLKRRRAMANKV